MTRIMKTMIAALFGATMLAIPALAQIADSDSMMEAGSPEANIMVDPNVDAGTTAAIKNGLERAMAKIGDGSVSTTIESMSEVGNVSVVDLNTLDDSDQARIDQAMTQKNAETQKLRTVIAANATISDELEANGMAASDVIAADIAADGSVIVYTR